ncbi:hypothetical protein SLA2020_412140 [Shorea laevis]
MIKDRAAEYWSTRPPSTYNVCGTTFFRWSKPPHPFLKLNTDGSVIRNPRKTSAGGLFRDKWGNWVMGYTRKIGWSSILVVELWSIRDGLKLAIDRNISHLIVESNSSTAIFLLSEDPSEFHPLSTLIFDCRDMLHQISHVKVVHMVWEANMAANAMAKVGHNILENFVIFDYIPYSIKYACIAEILGIEFPKTS